jgi:hypothetical protein
MPLRKEHWEVHIENILNLSSLVKIIHTVIPFVLNLMWLTVNNDGDDNNNNVCNNYSNKIIITLSL